MLVSSILWLYYYISQLFQGKDDSLNQIDNDFTNSLNNGTDHESLQFSSAYSFLVDGELKSTNIEIIPILPMKISNQLVVKVKESNNRVREVLGKNISNLTIPAIDDRDTILTLARLSSNSYFLNQTESNIEDPKANNFFSNEADIDWDSKALRGYIYTNPSKSLVILAIKGTSVAAKEDSTVSADRDNDNLMFSCCCARVDFSWDPVCPCYISGSSCSQGCLIDYIHQNRINPFRRIQNGPKQAVESKDRSPAYYHQAVKLYNQLLIDFPNATTIWVTGHSLGGAIASLLAFTFPGTSAVAFSSPGERLFAERLGLIPFRGNGFSDRDFEKMMTNVPIFHFYDSADPIPNGKCTGLWSWCYVAGYALESKCHLGRQCIFDSLSRSNSNYDIKKHRLSYLMDNIVYGAGSSLPKCTIQRDCHDCSSWTFVE